MLVPPLAEPSPRTGRWRLVLWAMTLAAVAGVIANRAPTAASDDAPAATIGTVSLGGQDDARRLAWIVELRGPIVTDGTLACLDAGPSCSGDAMLAADTTALRARSLAASLASATDPQSEGYLGNQPDDLRELAARTATTATVLADELHRWLSAGCGSSIDGVEVTSSRPPECPAWTATAREQADRLASVLAEWPTP